MNQKTTQRCTQVVAASLAPGEQIEMIEVAQIGKVSAKKQLGISAASVAVGVVTGGTLLVALKPRAYFLILTNERLFLVDNLQGSVGKKIVSAIPRNLISAGPVRTHLLTISMEVTVDGTPHKFSWGRFQGGMARRVAAALGAPGNE
jgi:hypothetical protein